MQLIDEKYLSGFEKPMMFDESTVRKKLKEYTEAGIIVTEKVGRKVLYSRAEDTDSKPHFMGGDISRFRLVRREELDGAILLNYKKQANSDPEDLCDG